MNDSTKEPFQAGDLVTVNYRGENILEAKVISRYPLNSEAFKGLYIIEATKIFYDHIHLATKQWDIGVRHEVGGVFLIPEHPLVTLAREAG